MNPVKNYKKEIILRLLSMIILCFVVLNLVLIQKAGAQGAVVSTEILSVPQTLTFGQEVAKWFKNDMVKGLRDTLAKRLIDYIVDQTIQGIQGGGKPLFVSDWKKFLKNAEAIAFDSVIKDVGLAGLCAPFKLQVRFALLPVSKFQQRIECTLDKIVSNIDNFYNDFKEGNWIAYTESWQPQNNFYGQLLIADDEIMRRMADESGAKKNEAMSSSGFLSVKKCVQPDYEYIEQCYNAGGTAENCTNVAAACNKYEIMTPGDSVGKSVAGAITSDTVWAANIQSWTAAIVNAAINRVFKEGLASVTGNDSEDYYPPEYQSLLEGEIDQQNQGIADSIQNYVDSWKTQRTSKENSVNYATQIAAKLPDVIEIQKGETTPPHFCLENTGTTTIASIESLNTLLAKYRDLDDVTGITMKSQLQADVADFTAGIEKGTRAKDDILAATANEPSSTSTQVFSLNQNFLSDPIVLKLGGPMGSGAQDASEEEGKLLTLLTKINYFLSKKSDATVCYTE